MSRYFWSLISVRWSGIWSGVAVCFNYISCTNYRLIGTIKESKMAWHGKARHTYYVTTGWSIRCVLCVQGEVNGSGLEADKASQHSVQPSRISNVSTAKLWQATSVNIVCIESWLYWWETINHQLSSCDCLHCLTSRGNGTARPSHSVSKAQGHSCSTWWQHLMGLAGTSANRSLYGLAWHDIGHGVMRHTQIGLAVKGSQVQGEGDEGIK